MSESEALAIRQQQLRLQEELVRRLETDILSRTMWNQRQQEFFKTEYHEALLSGANQIGKSTAARGYVAYHLTGRYPHWWEGHKWDKPIRLAVLGKTKEDVRDIIVNELLGPERKRGSGYIPEEDLQPFDDRIDYSEKRKGFISEVRVRHQTDGVYDGDSTMYVWTYGQGSQRPQGYPCEEVVQDEEPEHDSDEIHAELIARIGYTRGYFKCVMSPTNGATRFWLMFKNDETGEREFMPYSINDATHMALEHRDEYKRRWAGHIQEAARVHGMAVIGEGVVYPITDTNLLVDPDFMLTDAFPTCIGLDFPHTTGAFAAAKIAYDRKNDIVYLCQVYKAKGMERAVYAEKLRAMGAAQIPVEWPADGGVTAGGDAKGDSIADYYKKQGLNLVAASAHHLDSQFRKTNSVIPVIEEIFDRMRSGRFKVLHGCEEFLQEKTSYRWKDGRPFKSNTIENDIIDALHKAMMRVMRGHMTRETDVAQPWGQGGRGRTPGGFFSQRSTNRRPRRRNSQYRQRPTLPGDEFLS